MESPFQIKRYDVTKIDYLHKPELYTCPGEELEQTFSMSHRIGIAGGVNDGERIGHLMSHVEFEFVCEPDKTRCAHLIVESVCAFSVPESIKEDDFAKMIQLNGLATALPILRSSVISVSCSVGLPAQALIPNVDVRKVEWGKSESQ